MRIILIALALFLGACRSGSEQRSLIRDVSSGAMVDRPKGDNVSNIKNSINGLIVLAAPYALENESTWKMFLAVENNSVLLGKLRLHIQHSGYGEQYSITVYDVTTDRFYSESLVGYGFVGNCRVFKIKPGLLKIRFENNLLIDISTEL